MNIVCTTRGGPSIQDRDGVTVMVLIPCNTCLFQSLWPQIIGLDHSSFIRNLSRARLGGVAVQRLHGAEGSIRHSVDIFLSNSFEEKSSLHASKSAREFEVGFQCVCAPGVRATEALHRRWSGKGDGATVRVSHLVHNVNVVAIVDWVHCVLVCWYCYGMVWYGTRPDAWKYGGNGGSVKMSEGAFSQSIVRRPLAKICEAECVVWKAKERSTSS